MKHKRNGRIVYVWFIFDSVVRIVYLTKAPSRDAWPFVLLVYSVCLRRESAKGAKADSINHCSFILTTNAAQWYAKLAL